MPLSRSSTARRSSNVAVPRLVIVSASCTRCGSKVKTLGAELEPEPEWLAPLWPSASALCRRLLLESFEVRRFFGCGFGEGGPDSERERFLEGADSARSSSSSSLGLAPSPVPLPLCRLLSAAISATCMNGW